RRIPPRRAAVPRRARPEVLTVLTPFAAVLVLSTAFAPAIVSPPSGPLALSAQPPLVQPANPMVSSLALLSGGITGFGEPEKGSKRGRQKKPRRAPNAKS